MRERLTHARICGDAGIDRQGPDGVIKEFEKMKQSDPSKTGPVDRLAVVHNRHAQDSLVAWRSHAGSGRASPLQINQGCV